MRINEQTRIAALLKHHPDALEAIVRLSPDFKKLRNPVLRKLMAGRTSIAMAAKIGGCTPQDFFDALDGLGFEAGEAPAAAHEAAQQMLPDFLKEIPPGRLVMLDVRAMLAGGDDPLQLIQQTVKQLKASQVLKIVNSFEPVPLVRLLERQGFSAYVHTASTDLVETFFLKKDDKAAAPEPASATPAADGWDVLLERFAGKMQPLDVRHLEMPQPMMQILEALGHLPAGQALYVHHKRIPVFLLTELKERNFDYRIKEQGEGEVYLIIFKHDA
jgi:uncharacterized protein (DUF2249 family)